MPRHHTGNHLPQFSSSLQRWKGRRRVIVFLIAISVIIMLLTVVALAAAPSDFDTTFDGDGIVRTVVVGNENEALAVALQPDGKIVAVGQSVSFRFALARYNPNGSLDSSFGNDGIVATAFGNDSAHAVALQPDGKIVVLGSAAEDFALVRYNVDGSLDASFDGDGKVTTPIGTSTDYGFAVAIQPDGKIIAAGIAYSSSTGACALVRYNTDGTLDTSFDGDGKVTTSIGTGTSAAQAIALQPDGKIVVAGYAESGSQPYSAVARYNPDGSLDTSFDGDGTVITPVGGGGVANAIALQPDGKIVTAGYARIAPFNADFTLMRYNPGGSLDGTFDSDGIVTTQVTTASDYAYGVAIQPDGKIIAAGHSVSNVIELARYNPNGSLDTSFDGGDGIVTPHVSAEDQVRGIVLQPNGRIVIAGHARNGGESATFALERYTGDARPNGVSNFDTDRKTDISIWNPASGIWSVLNSTDLSVRAQQWGSASAGDRIVPGDYDGDQKTDFAVFRSTEGNWYIVKSSDGTATLRNWGGGTDIPVPGDYDLDGKTDTAIFRPSEGNWYIRNSRDNTVTFRQWGTASDIPVPADYDGDGATDIAVFRPSEGNWYIISSRDRFVRLINWGTGGDRPVQADYDGDGRVDVAVYRQGVWYIRAWTGAVTVRGWGDATDIAVPADYDGDGRADIALFRPSEANWYIIESSTNTGRIQLLGQGGDVPVPSAYLPQ